MGSKFDPKVIPLESGTQNLVVFPSLSILRIWSTSLRNFLSHVAHTKTHRRTHSNDRIFPFHCQGKLHHTPQQTRRWRKQLFGVRTPCITCHHSDLWLCLTYPNTTHQKSSFGCLFCFSNQHSACDSHANRKPVAVMSISYTVACKKLLPWATSTL